MSKYIFIFCALYLCALFGSSACFAQISIAVGGQHHSVIAGPGGVCGWGRNGNGEIGDATTTSPRTSPVAVSITGQVTKVVAGKTTTIFLKSNGTVWGCGYNEVGQLGQGTTVQQNTPIQITAKGGLITTFTDIACGNDQDHVLLLGTDGKVYPYGRNSDGELGTLIDGTCADYNSAATFCHTCTNATGINCEWAYADTYHNNVSIGNASCSAIWAGAYQSFFKKTDGTIWACGENTVGQLGDASTTDRYIPVQISTFAANTVSKISVGPTHTLFLKTDGTVWASGWNNTYELGDGTNTQRATPVLCSALPVGAWTWTDIAAGGAYSLFLRSDGVVWVVGGNLYGALGNGAGFPTSTITSPAQIGLTGITKIAAGSHGQTISLFLKSDNTLWSAGYNVNGQLGDGTTTGGPNFGKSTPVQVGTGSGCLPSILPVELHSFNASCVSGVVQCQWSTASEINNDYFTIERSTDGINWKETGTVPGAGNSSSVRNYEFIDESAVSQISNLSGGSPSDKSQIYFRLKKTDYDGRYNFYGPISVSCSPSDEWSLVLQNIFYGDELKGTLLLPDDSEINISVMDMQGRTIKQETTNAMKGSNLLKIEPGPIDKGIYFLKVSDGKSVIIRKFVRY